jgi:hypothetical protein
MKADVLEFEIRDDHIEPLRLFLTDNTDGLDPFEKNSEDPSVKAERWLFAMAVAVGTRWRFGDSFTLDQIIRFVADIRISMGEHASDVNPASPRNSSAWLSTTFVPATSTSRRGIPRST